MSAANQSLACNWLCRACRQSELCKAEADNTRAAVQILQLAAMHSGGREHCQAKADQAEAGAAVHCLVRNWLPCIQVALSIARQKLTRQKRTTRGRCLLPGL